MGEKDNYLPALQDAQTPLSRDQLLVLKHQFVEEGEYVSIQTRFNYAWGLIKSNIEAEQQLGIQILTDVFRDAPNRRRECLYYLAIGNFKLGNYSQARKYTDSLLEVEPENTQARHLKQMIEDTVAKEGLIGVAIAGGIVAVAATVVGALIKTRRR